MTDTDPAGTRSPHTHRGQLHEGWEEQQRCILQAAPLPADEWAALRPRDINSSQPTAREWQGAHGLAPRLHKAPSVHVCSRGAGHGMGGTLPPAGTQPCRDGGSSTRNPGRAGITPSGMRGDEGRGGPEGVTEKGQEKTRQRPFEAG